jgi:hypothetical protein
MAPDADLKGSHQELHREEQGDLRFFHNVYLGLPTDCHLDAKDQKAG